MLKKKERADVVIWKDMVQSATLYIFLMSRSVYHWLNYTQVHVSDFVMPRVNKESNNRNSAAQFPQKQHKCVSHRPSIFQVVHYNRRLQVRLIILRTLHECNARI